MPHLVTSVGCPRPLSNWNCPQHITTHFTLPDVEAAAAALRARIEELEAALKARD